MKEDQFDIDMKRSLEQHTDSMLKHKEDIWKNIEEELFMTQTQPSRKTTHTKRKSSTGKRIGWIISVVAAASIIGVFTTTNTGQALVNQIKQYFEPKKQVQEHIEGMPEDKEIVLQDTKSGYIIYIDEERYKMVEGQDRDVIVPNPPLDGDMYPEVSMSIEQVEDEAPEAAIARLQKELAEQYATVKEPEAVTEPLTATLLSGIDGNEWNSPVAKVYVLSNERGGSFIITEKYFLEASEGHGARFYYALEQFQIVEEVESAE